MLSKSSLAVVAACLLTCAPAVAATHKAVHHHKAAPTSAASDQTNVPSVLPTGVLTLDAPAPSLKPPFVTPTTLPCVTLTNSKWAANGNAKICGLLSNFNNAVAAYPGIQYATAGRWQPAFPNVLASQNLTGFGQPCPQAPPKSNPFTSSETCQFLNVWVPPGPAPAGGYPVMVFIHGGAFLEGAGSLPAYDGTAFAANNVILVTLNYRLGAFGFLVSNQAGVNATGNYGIMDQQMALNWVHDNIAAFGGNAGNITIFGESAGAMSVGLHLFSIPSSTGFFNAAIMESNPVGLVYRTLSSPGPSAIGNQFVTALCKNVPKPCTNNALLGLPTSTVLTVQNKFMQQFNFKNLTLPLTQDLKAGYFGIRGLPWQPVIDDSNLIMGQPYQGYVSGATPKPFIFGTNQDEGAVFAALVARIAGFKIVPASMSPSAGIYNAMVGWAFPQGTQPKPTVQEIADASDRYKTYKPFPPDYQKGAPYYNRNGQAASNIVLDYDFAIGNVVMANNALTSGGGANAPAIYAYHFTQPPLWDIYGDADNGACAPNVGNYVCHGSELVYVFNTLANVAPSNVTPTSEELTLASDMNKAWVAFATNQATPGTAWQHKYAAAPNQTGVPVVTFNASAITQSGAIDPNGVYDVWNNWVVTPVSENAPAAPMKATHHKKKTMH